MLSASLALPGSSSSCELASWTATEKATCWPTPMSVGSSFFGFRPMAAATQSARRSASQVPMKLRGDRPSLTQRSGKTKSPALYWEIAVEFGKKLGRDLDITGLSYALSGRRRLYGDGVFPRLPA